jgi:hypothetical protein
MAPSFSGVWKLQTKYQYSSAFPIDANLGAIGLYAGGVKTEGGTSYLAEVDKLLLAANGNATDFGDLSTNRGAFGTASSDTRMLTGGGFYNDTDGNDVQVNIIEYFTYATASNSTDYGDLTATKYLLNGLSNNVRGIFSGGSSSGSTINVIEYVTIATTGNATDFADLTSTYSNHGYGICASTTRGIIAGFNSNVIEYITIASAGNSTDFGDMTVTRKQGHAQMASATRGVFGGGRDNSNNASNIIDYITIASIGNATDFGDLAAAKYTQMGMSSLTKGFICGGYASSYENVIEQITIATTGNATDFGDLTRGKGVGNGASNGQAAFQDTAFAPAAMGLIAGANPTGNAAGMRTTIQYVNIASSGDAVMFGDLTQGSQNGSGVGSSTRAVFGIGATGGTDITSGETISNAMEFSTFSTKGKATDFGDLGRINGSFTGSSNSTIGLFAGGFHNASTPYVSYDFIDQITIASAGNATDHGDLTQARRGAGGVSNTTTAIFGGGYSSQAGALSNIIDSVAFASSGNATDFGDLTSTRQYVAGVSSSTRGVFAGGQQNVIDYITMSSAGNATDFGDLTASKIGAGSLSDKTSGVFPGGIENDTTIDVITIASTGNASDFGDLLYAGWNAATSASNSHGGLS